jgi:2-succinyl-5-enolpyruvyl-6-hydroxy-3-cyclohexene-1-carboxylate synthase
MPVRDVEAYFPQSAKPLRFLANRGANGIDGVVSSAVGAALATNRPAFLLTGELALLHDLGGLLAARRAGVQLTIVCLNNGGGGIFDFLPLAEHADRAAYEQHVATPYDVDFADVAALGGLSHNLASTPDEIRTAVGQPGLVEVRTDRAENVRVHRELAEAVAAQL